MQGAFVRQRTPALLSTWLQAAAVVPSASHEPGAWRCR